MLQKTHRISFHFFDIGGGDAIWIRFLGTDGSWHNILIDGGYGKEYKNAFGVLIRKLVDFGEMVDHWLISHIDRDHIGAAVGFVSDKSIKNKPDIVKNFIFNHSEEVVKVSNGKLSVGDGITLRDFLKINNLLTSIPVTTETQPVNSFGIKFYILSPTPEKEAEATRIWKLEERVGKIGRSVADADHTKTIEELKNLNFQTDSNVVNGSSVAILVEFGEIKALLLADSHPTDIVNTLTKLGYSKNNPIQVVFMQLAHHGSKANTSPELLDLVSTNNFVITGNGIHNRHPDKEAIVRLIVQEKRNDDVLNIHFASDTAELRNLFAVDENPFERFNFNCKNGQLGTDSKIFAYLSIAEHE